MGLKFPSPPTDLTGIPWSVVDTRVSLLWRQSKHPDSHGSCLIVILNSDSWQQFMFRNVCSVLLSLPCASKFFNNPFAYFLSLFMSRYLVQMWPVRHIGHIHVSLFTAGQKEMILYTHLLQQSLLHSIQFMKSSSVIFSKQIGQSILGIVGVFGMVGPFSTVKLMVN